MKADLDFPIGNPEAPSAGELEGAEPPRRHAGPAGVSKLDKKSISRRPVPPRAPLFHPFRGTVYAWRAKTAAAILEELRGLPKGKRWRDWKRKALELIECGSKVIAYVCSCGQVRVGSGVVLASCGLRTCPMCARRRSSVVKARITEAWTRGKRPTGMALYLLTFTLQYDPSSPSDLSVEGLQRRKSLACEGWSFVWRRYLKRRGHAAIRAVEVSPHGMVHLHVLYHGRFPDIEAVRSAWMFKVGDSPQVNSQYVRNPSSAIAEVVKYVAKGASPARVDVLRGGVADFTDPRLAARIELAFYGDRLVECYGAWRGIDPDEELPEPAAPEAPCPGCGLSGQHHSIAEFRIDVWMRDHAGGAAPRLSRTGTPAPPGTESTRKHNEGRRNP